MSPPAPRINTYMNAVKPPIIDVYSKIFIIIELLLGTNRLFILGLRRKVYTILTFGYSLSFHIALLYFVLNKYHQYIFRLIVAADLIQFLLCSVLAYVCKGRLLNFYFELNKFDDDIGFEASKTEKRKILQNYVQIIFTIVLSLMFYCINNNLDMHSISFMILLPMKLLHCFELHYYGHLFILLIPRIKLITKCIKYSYPIEKDKEQEKTGHTKKNHNLKKQIKNYSKIDMKRLIFLYNKIIIIFDFLYESIKWQMLILIVITLSISLDLSFNIAKGIITGKYNYRHFSVNIAFSLVELLPLLVPCIYAEQVCGEVRRLKDLLSSKLYENTLDKPTRSSARSLLTLIETRNLSFSLFHMFDIDIALPFKFLGLLLTYLIILLQFDKVINAD